MTKFKNDLSHLEICKIHAEGSSIIKSIKYYLQAELDSGVCWIPDSGNIFSITFESLEDLHKNICNCKRCDLAKSRTNIVFGQGNNNANLLFIGDAPSSIDDKNGIPFIDEAGILLNKIIKAISLTREDVYLCNVIKCYKPDESMPNENEVFVCRDFLLEQIRLIKPDIICCLGSVVAHSLLKTDMPLDQLRGKFHKLRLDNDISVIVTYHPRILLINLEKKVLVWDDMKMLKAKLQSPKS